MVPNQSRAERTTSYAVADFPQPTGREEEWRFTPVDRLGALFHDEATGACLERGATTLPEGVTLGTASVEEWRASGAPAPGDRAAAVAAAHVAASPCSTSPPTPSSTSRVRIRLAGTAHEVVHGHAARAGRPVRPRHRRARARRHLRVQRGRLGRRRRRRAGHPGDRAGVGRRRAPPGPARPGHRPRRRGAAHRRDDRRRHRPVQHQRHLHRPRRLVRGPGRLLRRCRAAPRAPPVRRPRGAAVPLQRRVQGRAPGRHRAHRVGRRRADPRQRRGHRHLRAQPQPGAHRGRPRRLGAQPRDRDR